MIRQKLSITSKNGASSLSLTAKVLSPTRKIVSAIGFVRVNINKAAFNSFNSLY